MLPLPFGTRSAYTDSFPSPPPSQVTISQETCFNLSMFRNVVRQYRKMDDQIITRLNRAQAQMRDQFRIASSSTYNGGRSSNGSAQDAEAMCLQLWQEMMAGWAHRQTMLSFCIQTVNSSIEAKNPAGLSGADEKLIGTSTSPAGGSRHRGWKEDEVLDEESVEAIIRKRTLEAFKSRCPFFSPPASDTTSRTWWELAERGRIGRGPDLA